MCHSLETQERFYALHKTLSRARQMRQLFICLSLGQDRQGDTSTSEPQPSTSQTTSTSRTHPSGPPARKRSHKRKRQSTLEKSSEEDSPSPSPSEEEEEEEIKVIQKLLIMIMPKSTFIELNVSLFLFPNQMPRKRQPSVSQRLAKKVKAKVGLSPSKTGMSPSKFGATTSTFGFSPSKLSVHRLKLRQLLRPKVLLRDIRKSAPYTPDTPE